MIPGLPDTRETAGASPARPFFTVAICSRNRAASLAAAARSVLPQLGDDAELLLVDNDSTDATPAVMVGLAAADPRVRTARQSRRGIAAARNLALEQARGRVVVFIDDDELALPDWLDAFRDFLRRHPEGAWAAAGGPYLSAPETPLPAWIEAQYGRFDHGGDERMLPAPLAPAGGNLAVWRNLALAVGGFDESLPRHEDSALSGQLRAAGHAIWWTPSARVRHLIPASRLTFQAQCRMWFSEGVAVVPFRLRTVKGRGRRVATLSFRMLAAPIQAAGQALASGLCWLVCRHHAAARLYLRACRSAGVASESARWVGTGRFRQTPRR
jgi:hypothetical protein